MPNGRPTYERAENWPGSVAENRGSRRLPAGETLRRLQGWLLLDWSRKAALAPVLA